MIRLRYGDAFAHSVVITNHDRHLQQSAPPNDTLTLRKKWDQAATD
jgi:hypothetical protein